MLEVAGLASRYGRIPALAEISLRVQTGELVAIVGANGAGKTTLLRSLSGVQPSTATTLSFEGADIRPERPRQRVQRGIVQVPEGRQVFGAMSVEDNLLLGGYRQVRLGSKKGGEVLEQVYTLFPRLKERRAQLAGTLSGGERQMLAVGRALMGQPDLLMLDEPSLGLAPLVVKEIFRTIEGLRATGVTILLVEQNARAALEVADHGYVLEMGEIALEGPAEQLANDPRVIDTYLGAARQKTHA